jgi:hypothetical protein
MAKISERKWEKNPFLALFPKVRLRRYQSTTGGLIAQKFSYTRAKRPPKIFFREKKLGKMGANCAQNRGVQKNTNFGTFF